ncbi:MAG: sel1 repeat family protein [Oscillospiraceae bacterium]|nr:sel1 repeat family protein [Oscillospiraceae bacterium]
MEVNISYLPAVAQTFVPEDGEGREIFVFRPYAAIPLSELEEHAEQQNDRGSLLELGERYYFGLGVEQNYEKAIAYLIRAAEQNVQDAQFLIAECYRCGYYVKQDYEKYFQWLDAAAKNGSWKAMFNLCAAYREGKKAYGGFGPKIDHTQSFAWSLQAEKTILGYWSFYTQANFVDFDEIKKELLRAYARITHQIAAHYAEGMGVNRDLTTALGWLQKGKRFVSNATGEIRVPLFERSIERLKQRIAKYEEKKLAKEAERKK